MNWFEHIKKWFEAGFWTETMVGNAVQKGKITPGQFAEITAQTY